MWKEIVVAYLKTLSQHSSEETEENYRQQITRFGVLPQHQVAWSFKHGSLFRKFFYRRYNNCNDCLQ